MRYHKKDKDRVPYVYECWQISTGKRYIGSRSGKGCHPSEFGIKYFTSSKIVKPQMQTNIEDWFWDITICATKQEAYKLESELHEKYKVHINDKFYNKATATKKFNNDSKETRKKMSKSAKSRVRTKEELEKWLEIIKKKKGIKIPPRSESWKIKQSKSQKKSKDITCEKCGKVMKMGNYKRWHGENCGKKVSKEYSEKMSKVQRGKKIGKKYCPNCEKYIPKNNYNRYHGKNCGLGEKTEVKKKRSETMLKIYKIRLQKE